MRLRFDLTSEDYDAFLIHALVTSDAAKAAIRRERLILWAAAPVLVAVFSLIVPSEKRLIPAIGAFVVLLVMTWFAPRRLRKGLTRRLREERTVEGGVIGEWTLEPVEAGLAWEHLGGAGIVPWREIVRVEQTESGVFAFIDPDCAYVAPSSAFADRAAASAYAEELSTHMATAAAGDAAAIDTPTQQD